MRLIKLGFSLLLICLLAVGQTALDNATILKLMKAGIGEDTIVGMVNQQPGKYALAADDMIALKNAGVTDKVIAAMVVRNGLSPQPPQTQTTAAIASVPSPPSATAPLILHDATPIRLRLNRNLSSADAKTGDNVDFEVLDDLKIDDVMLIPRGGIAIATITEAEHKRRMARGGKLDVNIDYVRLVNGDKVALRAMKEVKGGGHTGAMTGAIVATALVAWPAAPFFLFMHGKDGTIPKGTEITAYVNGEIQLERAKFVAGPPAQMTAANVPSNLATPSLLPPTRTTSATPAPDTRILSLAPEQPAAPPVAAPPQPVQPATPQPSLPPAALPQQPVAETKVAEAPNPSAPEPADKAELTVTSNPTGAKVDVNGIVVGTTPATIALAKGTNFKVTVNMDGYLLWEVQSIAVSGHHTMNAALSKVVVFR